MKTSTVFFARITTLLVLLVLVNTSTATQAGWPASISGDSGFADLGRAIKNEPGFPANGTEIDKARYVFSRMQDVAQSYGLQPGSGRPVSNIVVGLYRLKNDPEGAECLKGALGWGNCGEWSYAMSEIFGGAGVNNRVAYGDKSGGTGKSLSFTGTDTMVIVEERSPDGKVSRRVFDAFRAAYHSDTSQPTAKSLQEWGDMPLTDYDKWKDETRQSWQSRVSKPFIKDAVTQSELVLPFQTRTDPSTTNRPVASGIESATITVSNEKPEKIRTSFATQTGAIYVIEASGVVSDWADKTDGVDAVWCYAEWRCGKQGQVWDQLRINGKGMTELAGKPIPYNPKHVYQIELAGTGYPIEFFMIDAQGSAGDNHGSITVKITRRR